VVVQLVFLFLICKISNFACVVFMDDLTRAAAQFLPSLREMNGESALGGMNGGFNPPPADNNSAFFVAAASHEAGPSSSNAVNHNVPDIFQQEVPLDAVWDAVHEEKREELELRNSKEWKEAAEHIQKLEYKKHFLAQRAREIAHARGFDPRSCEDVENAARYVAESVKDVPKRQQLCFLTNLIRNLNNPKSKTWKDINKEVQRWR